MVAENTAQLWFLIKEALSPSYLYQYAIGGGIAMSFIAPILFGMSISMRSGFSLFASLKGNTGDVRQAWLQVIVVAFGYGLYIGSGYVFLSVIVEIWNSFGAFSNGKRSIEAIFYDAFAHAEQQDSSLWDLAKDGASFFIFLAAEICRIGYMIVTMFLGYAHAILFMILYMSGPIVIPLAIVKQLDFTKGWWLGWKVVIFWPVFEIMLRFGTQIPFEKVASVIESSTASGGSIKIIIFTAMIIIYFFAGAIAVMVPFFTNAMISGAGIVASAVAPMVAGALGATAMLGGAMKQGSKTGTSALKSAGAAAVPGAVSNLASNLNQKGPSMLKNTLANSAIGKQMGQLGSDLKASMAPVANPMAKAAKSTAGAVGKGFGLDTKQVASDFKSMTQGGNAKPSSGSPGASKPSMTRESSSATATATPSPAKASAVSAASSAMTAPEGADAPEKSAAEINKNQQPDAPKPKKKTAKAKQAKRGAMVNKAKKAKKD